MGAARPRAAMILQGQSTEADVEESAAALVVVLRKWILVLEVVAGDMEAEDVPSKVIVVCSTTTTVAGVLQYSCASSLRAWSVAEGP